MADPTELHEGECYRCNAWVRDRDVLNNNLECPSCVDEIEQEMEDDDS